MEGKIYVGDLGGNPAKGEIEEKFEKFGRLKDVWIARNPPGFAFLVYEDSRDADDAVREMDGAQCCGNRIRVEHARARAPRGGPRGGGRGRAPRDMVISSSMRGYGGRSYGGYEGRDRRGRRYDWESEFVACMQSLSLLLDYLT